MIPMTRGATKRRSGSERMAPYHARRLAPPIALAAPPRHMTTAMAGDRGGRREDAGDVEEDDAASTNPRVSPKARIAIVTPRRLPSVRRSSDGTRSWAAEKVNGQDPDDRRHGGRRAEGEQERDRQAVAGEGDDGGRSDPDPLVGPVAPVAEGAPLVDGEPGARMGGAGGKGRGAAGTRRWYAAVPPGRQSRVIVTPEPSSSVTSTIGPRRPVRIASRTRST